MCSDGINRKKKGSRKGPKQMPGSNFSQKQKNVWNDLDKIMQLRVKHWATQGNSKVSRGTWDTINVEMQGIVKVSSNVVCYTEILMLN